MDEDSFFFDQSIRGTHLGGFYRLKRDEDDFHRALYHVKIILANQTNFSSENSSRRNSSSKQISKKSSDDLIMTHILRQLNIPLLPEVLTKELDQHLQFYLEHFHQRSSIISKSTRTTFINNQIQMDQISSEENRHSLTKISLPSTLIVQLHSTWNHLIQHTKYHYKVKSIFFSVFCSKI